MQPQCTLTPYCKKCQGWSRILWHCQQGSEARPSFSELWISPERLWQVFWTGKKCSTFRRVAARCWRCVEDDTLTLSYMRLRPCQLPLPLSGPNIGCVHNMSTCKQQNALLGRSDVKGQCTTGLGMLAFLGMAARCSAPLEVEWRASGAWEIPLQRGRPQTGCYASAAGLAGLQPLTALT